MADNPRADFFISDADDELLATNCLYAEIAASQLVGNERIDGPGTCDLEDE
ncbi:MAG: hypothetical protein HGB10_03270 [Coriobacteriia bacterium]|nr:hypothetical protein [Coriobacteriia bacterium]